MAHRCLFDACVCASDDDIVFCTGAAPALALAQKVLDNGDQHVSPKIRELCFLKHRLIHHKHCALPPPKQALQPHNPSACWIAGVFVQQVW